MILLLCSLFTNLLFNRGLDFFSKKFFVHALFFKMQGPSKKRAVIGKARPRYVPRPRAGMRFSAAYPVSVSRQAAGMVARDAVRRAGLTNKTLKGVDTIMGPYVPWLQSSNTNGGVYVLNLVQQGAGSWNRIGKRIKMKSLRIRGFIEALFDNSAQTVPTRAVCCRVVVVYDRQNTGGAIPTFDTIFGETIQTGAESSNIMANLRYDNTDRFRVIRDVVRVLNPTAIPASGEEGVVIKAPIDEFIDLKGLETVFGGQSNPMTIADISSGALYVFFRADPTSGAATTTAFSGETTARLRYTD